MKKIDGRWWTGTACCFAAGLAWEQTWRGLVTALFMYVAGALVQSSLERECRRRGRK